MTHLPLIRPCIYVWAPMNTPSPTSKVSMCLKPTPLPTLSPCPTRRASARHIARLINVSKSPSPSAKREYSSSSPARSYLPRKCSASSIWKSGSGAASRKPWTALTRECPARVSTPGSSFSVIRFYDLNSQGWDRLKSVSPLAQRFSERRNDVLLFILGHLRVKRQKQ